MLCAKLINMCATLNTHDLCYVSDLLVKPVHISDPTNSVASKTDALPYKVSMDLRNGLAPYSDKPFFESRLRHGTY